MFSPPARAVVACLLLVSLPALLAAADEAAAEDVRDPRLRAALLCRKDIEQRARHSVIAWLKAHGPFDLQRATAEEQTEWNQLTAYMIQLDVANTCWLKGVVDRQGWPTHSQVGEDGAGAAWLLVQHADLDPAFQRRALDLMAELPAGEVSPERVAYLTDRVLLAEGKKQRYGTQFHIVDGRHVPRPLEDPAGVDRRRAEAGLSPLAEYARGIEKTYGPAK